MSENITWTHVDKLVRKEIEDRGQLAIGLTDAEVAYNLLKFLLKDCQQNKAAAATLAVRYDLRNAEYEALRRETLAPEKTGKKTKQRIEALESQIAELWAFLKPPVQVVDVFGPKNPQGWYEWKLDGSVRPAGRVDIIDCHGQGFTGNANDFIWGIDTTIELWRPAQ